MIDLSFDPDLTLGALRLTWHALLGLVAVIAGAATGIAFALRAARARGIRFTFDDAYAVALGGVVGGLVVSRVFHVADRWSFYARRPLEIVAVQDGGASIVGGIVGGLSCGLLVIWLRRLRIGFVFDHCTVGLPVGMAIGRIGDIVNGEHWATACAGLPWCVRYTHPTSPGQREFVHPAVAYELVLDLAIALVLLRLAPWADREPRAGQIPFVFLGLYGAGRLALSAVRLDPIWVFGLTQAQLVSALFVIVAVAALAWLRRPMDRGTLRR